MTDSILAMDMSKLKSLVGFLKFFFGMSAEDFRLMDRKLLRIGVAVITFLVWAFFWFYFFRGSSPFGF